MTVDGLSLLTPSPNELQVRFWKKSLEIVESSKTVKDPRLRAHQLLNILVDMGLPLIELSSIYEPLINLVFYFIKKSLKESLFSIVKNYVYLRGSTIPVISIPHEIKNVLSISGWYK